MAKTKVILRANTIGAKAGDTIEVEKDVADALVANRNAFLAKDAPAEAKGK